MQGGGLRLVGLARRFGAVSALADVSLEIRRGEFLTLLGPSGSGKTTLLMLLAGFLEPSAGDILLDGASIAHVPPERRNFGMVFQGYALFPHMSVRRNIAYPLEVRRTPRAAIAARVDEMLDLVRLGDLGERLPRQLSGGQQQRVALARALAFAPPVLLLDEPLGALDAKLRIEVQRELRDLHRRVGTTFVFVTHDQEEALSMSDRIVIMNRGRIVQTGAPDELYERPATRFAASFLGRANFIRAGGRLHALRPEKIDVAPRGGTGLAVRATGRVTSAIYQGAAITLAVATAEHGEIEVAADAWRMPHRFAEGAEVDLAWTDAAAVPVDEDADEDPGDAPAERDQAGRRPA